MGRPQKRDTEVLKEALAVIQVARPPSLRLFDDLDDGVVVVERKKVEVLNLSWEVHRLRWEQIHNDPNIVVVDEKDHAVKIGVTTIVRYIQKIASNGIADDPHIAELWPE